MEELAGHKKFTDIIGKEEFVRLFSEGHQLSQWFTGKELETFSFPRNAGSLAARYLVKKRICLEISRPDLAGEIQILNDPLGKPVLEFGNELNSEIKKAGITRIMCSLSHSRHYIAGVTVICF